MGKPATYNLVLYQGTTVNLTFTWKDATGALMNLTGYVARMKVRDPNTGGELLSVGTATGEITLGGALGTIHLLLSAAATAAFTWGTGRYDLELESGGGVVTRLLMGTVSVNREVTY